MAKQPESLGFESLPQQRRKHGPLRYFDRQGKEIDVRTWSEIFEYADRQIALDTIENTTVDTVWMGITRYFDDAGRPLVYETLVWGIVDEMHIWPTEAEALAGHARMCAAVRTVIEHDKQFHTITADEFLERFGVEPQQDDLHRATCDRAGTMGHWMCGVCDFHKQPRFVCGCLLTTPNDRFDR